MGNRAFVYLFLIAALSFLFTAVSAAALSARKKKSLRMGAIAWTAVFLCGVIPLITGNSIVDLFLYGDWTGGMRVVTTMAGHRLGQVCLPYRVLNTVRTCAEVLTLVWITAGGAHHTVLSYDVSAEQMKDFANMMQIEFVHITSDTTVEALEEKLMLSDLLWKLS